MTVEQLIRKLQKCDQKAQVICQSSNFEFNGADIKLQYVHESKTGEKKTRTFTDAFDYEKYEAETWSILGGHLSVVKLS